MCFERIFRTFFRKNIRTITQVTSFVISLSLFVRDASAIFDLNRRSSVFLRRKNSKNLHLYFIFSRQALHPALTVWRKCYLVYYFFMGCSKRKKRTLWANTPWKCAFFSWSKQLSSDFFFWSHLDQARIYHQQNQVSVILLPCLRKESFAKHLTAKWKKLINNFNFVQLPRGYPVSIVVFDTIVSTVHWLWCFLIALGFSLPQHVVCVCSRC